MVISRTYELLGCAGWPTEYLGPHGRHTHTHTHRTVFLCQWFWISPIMFLYYILNGLEMLPTEVVHIEYSFHAIIRRIIFSLSLIAQVFHFFNSIVVCNMRDGSVSSHLSLFFTNCVSHAFQSSFFIRPLFFYSLSLCWLDCYLFIEFPAFCCVCADVSVCVYMEVFI